MCTSRVDAVRMRSLRTCAHIARARRGGDARGFHSAAAGAVRLCSLGIPMEHGVCCAAAAGTEGATRAPPLPGKMAEPGAVRTSPPNHRPSGRGLSAEAGAWAPQAPEGGGAGPPAEAVESMVWEAGRGAGLTSSALPGVVWARGPKAAPLTAPLTGDTPSQVT